MASLRHKLAAYHLYLLISAVGSFAMSIITTINLVYQIEVIKLNPLQLVLVGTMLECVCFLCQVPTGALADAYSRRLAVVVGYLLVGAGFLLEGLVPTFAALLLAQVLWGGGYTLVNGAEEAWIASEMGDEAVGNAFMRATQIGQVAALLSIPLSVWLATWRLSLPVLVGGGLFLLLGLFLFVFMPENNFQATPREERSSWQTLGKVLLDGSKIIRRSRMLLLILAITVFAGMASEGFDRLNVAHFLHDYQFPTLGQLSAVTWFGIISAGSMLLTLLATEIVRRVVDLTNQRAIVTTMFFFDLCLIASITVFALAGNFYLALLAFWLGRISRRADSPLYTIWITRNSDPRMRATVNSMFGQFDALGQIAGGPLVGYIGTVVSIRAAILATSTILSPTIIFFAGALRLSKPFFSYPQEEEVEQEKKEDVGIEMMPLLPLE